MASSTTGSFRTCPHGHPVLAVDLFCSTCGVPLKGKRSKAAAAAVLPDENDDATDTEEADADDDAPGRPPGLRGLGTAIAGAGRTTWIAAAMVLATAIVTVIVAATVHTASPGAGEGPGTGPGLTGACGGAAQEEIGPNATITTTNDRLCVEVGETSSVTLGAIASSKDVDLLIEVARPNGEQVASNDDAYGDDPEVNFDADPGMYLISISRYGGGSIGVVTVYAATVPVADAAANALPTLDDCASLSAPTIEDSGTGDRAAGEPFTCLTLDSPAFTKIGAEADANAPTDLALAVYAFDDTGTPQFVRSNDDTFGTDPEVNVDLAAGHYLIQVSAHDDGALGPYSVYVDTTGTFTRTSDVSSGLATLTPSSCAALPKVVIGTALPFGSGTPQGCLTLEKPTRVVIMAATTVAQDLTLEVVGFDSIGAPRRYVWADEDVFGEDYSSQDPRVDLVLPAGSYVIAVDDYWGEAPAHDFVLTVDPGGTS